MRRMRSICSSVVRAGCGALVGWKAAHVFEPNRRSPAEIVRAHPNMIEASSLDEAHDVVGDLLEARLRRRAMLGLQFGQLGLGIGGDRRLAVSVARAAQPVA